MTTHGLVEQTQNAFDFVKKLHFEISYLIKEVEGLLQQEEEEFVIVRPSGYGVTTRTSTGLEPINVENWLPKTFTVFFVPESMTTTKAGQTRTLLNDSLRIVFLHIDLLGKHVEEPILICGCLRDIVTKKTDEKFELLASGFAYSHIKMFAKLPNISYAHSKCSFEGKAFQLPLFSINSSEDVSKKLIETMLNLYRA